MRKEVILAVFFGIILGGIILYGINLANNSVDRTTSRSSTPSAQNTTPTPTQTLKKTFDILVPQDHAVIAEKIITLRGIAEPNSTVAIVTEQNDIIIDTSSEGTFSAQINLIPGANQIKVVQGVKGKETQTITISVIQSDTIPE